MKKIVSAVLCLTFALLLAGCVSEGAKGNENKPNVPENYEETGNEEPANKEAAAEQEDGLSAENWEQIAAILEAGQWNTGTSDCLSDYTLEWNGRKLSYHSDCGTFNEPGVGENGRSLRLTEEEKQVVNTTVQKLTASQSEGDEVLQVPPVLTVTCGEASVEACRGSTSWLYWKEDGSGAGIQADSMHPLQMKKYMTPLCLLSDTDSLRAYLQFGTVPGAVRVQCWSDRYWDRYDAKAEPVEVIKLMVDHDGEEIAPVFFIQLKDGNYIYEVAAEWNHPEKYEGTAYYSFYTEITE